MRSTKRQDLPPGLWIVATPIGNLQDITLRALDVLEEVSIIFCEDTRQVSQLLSGLGISMGSKKLFRLDAHSSEKQIRAHVENLKHLQLRAALVTDAGTPGVSDPGYQMVRVAQELQVRVGPIPGPSAVIAFASVCGLPASSFLFRGFFPRGKSDQEKELGLAHLSPWECVLIWFESPKRIVSSLEQILIHFPDAVLCVGKELTKIYEKLFFGPVESVYREVVGEIEVQGERGEWVLGLSVKEASGEPSLEWEKTLHCLLQAQVSVATSVKVICQRFDVPKRMVYASALKISAKEVVSGS